MSKDGLDEATLGFEGFNARRYQQELGETVHRCLVDGCRLMGRWCPRCKAHVHDDFGDWLYQHDDGPGAA